MEAFMSSILQVAS